MLQQISIHSSRDFDFGEYAQLLGVKDLVLSISPEEVPDAWGFYREGQSTTLFSIERGEGEYVLSMDSMASYDDYAFFPYLADTLSSFLCDSPYLTKEGESAFQAFDEEWTEYCIGEEVAYLKCLLSIGQKYYFELPLSDSFPYITEALLNEFGVTLHSSSPRIYGYIQYMLRHSLVPEDDEREEMEIEDVEVDVPQHESIGIVRSWQTDGAETTESYSVEDVDLLLAIGRDYEKGKHVPGVVLNDIGTVFEHGLDVEVDIPTAVRWYKEAIRQGDRYYAPTNLGDIYRRGLLDGRRNAVLALEAYRLSEDPYAWYRIGQSYEEGWVEAPDLDTAMVWFNKAAAVGLHLAIRRLKTNENETRY